MLLPTRSTKKLLIIEIRSGTTTELDPAKELVIPIRIGV
jgi:hypothetical protein